jgi:hypothetical protein
MKEAGPPLKETFKTNDSEFYTDFTSMSAAAVGVASSQEKAFDVKSKGISSSAQVMPCSVYLLIMAAGNVLLAM